MARLSGASTFDIMFKEMMPNLLPYLAASFSGNVSANILAATGLGRLGLGPTRVPTLGMTIFYSIRAASILRGMWWWWGFPILLLIIIFTGLFPDRGRAGRDCQSTLERSPGRMTVTMNRTGVQGRTARAATCWKCGTCASTTQRPWVT